MQPVVEIAKDLPNGVDVRTHYLLDAITSASVAAGVKGDNAFTEMRNEVELSVGKTFFDRTRIGLTYRYSAESDYWSHGFALSLSHRFWGDTATLSAFVGGGYDYLISRVRTIGANYCTRPRAADDPGCSMVWMVGGLSYSQVLSPTLLAAISYEMSHLDGFQASPYRNGVPGLSYDRVPSVRTRHSVTPRVTYYIPETRTGLRLYYRYYWDSWSIDAHMLEGRVYQALSRDLEIRLSYRYYRQTAADFWCDFMANSTCYGTSPAYWTSDPKLTPVTTSMPEVKLIWDAVRLRGVPFFGWFSEGTFDISYARYIQNTSFGNANVIQAGYSMPY